IARFNARRQRRPLQCRSPSFPATWRIIDIDADRSWDRSNWYSPGTTLFRDLALDLRPQPDATGNDRQSLWPGQSNGALDTVYTDLAKLRVPISDIQAEIALVYFERPDQHLQIGR